MDKRLLILLFLLVAACGGTAATTTAADDATTTTAPDDEDEGSGVTVDFADLPQECIDAFVDFLQAIEPVVEGFDFEGASFEDMEAIGTEMEAVAEGPSLAMENLDCPDPGGTDEEAFAAMIDIAEREAPGTVGYFEWIEGLAGAFGEGEGTTGAVSGDCETDIERLELLIDQNDGMGDMPLAEVTAFGSLMTAITTECSADRVQEFLSQPEVEEFMASGG